MNDKYILKDKVPVPVSLMVWARWLDSNDDQCIVKQTQLGEVMVSTVFLGLDHNFSGAGRPLLFETMVFGGALSDEMQRYSTWAEAEEGHQRMVEAVRTTADAGPEAMP